MNSRPPVPQTCGYDHSFALPFTLLAGFPLSNSGLISGFLQRFQRLCHLLRQYVCFYICVVQRLLDELEIADRIIERLTYLHILRRTRERAILISYRGMRVSGR